MVTNATRPLPNLLKQALLLSIPHHEPRHADPPLYTLYGSQNFRLEGRLHSHLNSGRFHFPNLIPNRERFPKKGFKLDIWMFLENLTFHFTLLCPSIFLTENDSSQKEIIFDMWMHMENLTFHFTLLCPSIFLTGNGSLQKGLKCNIWTYMENQTFHISLNSHCPMVLHAIESGAWIYYWDIHIGII